MDNLKLTRIDFNKLGMEIATSYINKEIPTLQDGVISIAKKLNLNSNGVKRLSEKANHFTQMYILKFADDKKKEFTVVNPDEAVFAYSKSKTKDLLEKEASVIVNESYSKDIPDFYQLDYTQTSVVKQADSPRSAFDFIPSEAGKFKQLLYKRAALKDKINSLLLEKMASTLTMDEELEQIYNMYNHTTAPSFIKVAYDIYNKYKDESYPLIKNISINLKKPIGDNFKKEAAAVDDHIIDDTTTTMLKVSSFIEAQRNYLASDRALQSYTTELNIIEDSIREAGGLA